MRPLLNNMTRRFTRKRLKPHVTPSNSELSSSNTTTTTTTNHSNEQELLPPTPQISSPPPGKKSSSTDATTEPNQDDEAKMELFRTQYHAMKEMRRQYPAPVDTMGCHTLAQKDAPENVKRYHTLVSLLLSSQTKDTVTAAAMGRLKKEGLTIDKVMNHWTEERIQELIRPVGFYKRKAGYMKRIATILHNDYNDDIPNSIDGLLKLPGIGPKMGYLIMTHAWNDVQGIGVDVHVHRISNRLEWVDTNTPEETRKALEEWLPKEYWEPINGLVVGFGQTICASRPKCSKCQLATGDDLCPYYARLLREEEEEEAAEGSVIPNKKKSKRKRRKLNPQKEQV